ncbi:MAG: hypothetical protein QXP84_07005 [Candidatus Korarchaeum sp.]
MGSVGYTAFGKVERATKEGVFRNEEELKNALVEALKGELLRSECSKYIVNAWLRPSLDEALKSGGRPDIRLSNLIIEVKAPGVNISEGQEQLLQYMSDLYRQLQGKTSVYGVITNGVKAELYKYDERLYEYGKERLYEGDMAGVLRKALELFCMQKIPVLEAKDLIALFGV